MAMNLLTRPVESSKLRACPLRSSLGSKFVMALTGLGLFGFVIAHMIGNLLLFAGPDALNSYAHTLKENGELLWPARVVLLALFIIHIVLGIRLAYANRQARPVRYQYEDTVQASWSSRHMLSTGLVLLAFVVYHLAHFTFGVVVPAHEQRNPDKPSEPVKLDKDRNYLELSETREAGKSKYIPDYPNDLSWAQKRGLDARPDVYSMVVSGFRNPWISISYLVAMIFLWLHLWHGGSSWFQSLGINHPRYNGILQGVGPVIATILLIGNSAIVLSVWLGLVR
jgi:succinate dehydrogenase / fumarate reductase cytochrome b subunit